VSREGGDLRGERGDQKIGALGRIKELLELEGLDIPKVFDRGNTAVGHGHTSGGVKKKTLTRKRGSGERIRKGNTNGFRPWEERAKGSGTVRKYRAEMSTEVFLGSAKGGSAVL